MRAVGGDEVVVAELAAAGPPAGGARRLRLDLRYDGTDFAGWAEQPGLRTVCGELRAALATLFRAPVAVVVAGRTDAGVHAAGQVAHIDVDGAALAALAPRPQRVRPGIRAGEYATAPADGCAGLLNRLAGLLPADVRVTAVTPAPAGFDARFAALRRHYRYRIGTARHGVDPLRRHDTYALRRPLDRRRDGRGGPHAAGHHDFAAYCRPPSRPDATTIRDLQELSVVCARARAGGGRRRRHRRRVLPFDGALDRRGADRGRHRPAGCRRSRAGCCGTGGAPPNCMSRRRTGLTLVAVDYPPDVELAARAVRTRAVRGRDH